MRPNVGTTGKMPDWVTWALLQRTLTAEAGAAAPLYLVPECQAAALTAGF